MNSTAVPREELTDVVMESVTTDEMFSGLKLLPAYPTSKLTAHVPKIEIGTGQQMRASVKTRRPGSGYDRWQATIGAASITLLQVAEEVSIPDETSMEYDDYFAVESVFSIEANNRLRRGHELDAEDTIFDTGTFTNATAAIAAYTAANVANGTLDLPGDVQAAIRRVKALGNMPDTIAIPGPVWDRARTSTLLKSFIAGSINPGATVTAGNLVKAFYDEGIRKAYIMDAYVNQSDADLSNDINPIWPNTYIFVGSTKEGKLETGGIGRTFYWDKDGAIFNISSYRDEPKSSNIIRAKKTTLTEITNAKAGTLITTNYA